MVKRRLIHHVTDLEPGDHLCCLYETEREHRALLAPFLRLGLEQGEKVLCIVDTHTAGVILEYLREDGIDIESYQSKGQFSILTVDATYTREGVFDPERMIGLLRDKTQKALREGYPALRVAGEMAWILQEFPGFKRFFEYEVKLSEFFSNSACLALCLYDRRRFDPSTLLDVLRSHPIAVIGTNVCENVFYVPLEELLDGDRPAATLRRWLERLAECYRLEETFVAPQRQLHHLFSSFPTIIYVCKMDPDSTIEKGFPPTFISEHLTRLFGYTVEECLGDPTWWSSHLHPEDVPVVFTNFPRLFETGSHVHEYRFQHKDGTYRWVHDEVVLVRDSTGNPVEMVGSWTDITERRRAEQALRESEERLRQLIESSQGLIILLHDLEGRFLYFNGASSFGIRPEEVIGKTPFDIFEPSTAARIVEQVQQVAARGQSMDFEHRVAWRGEKIWFYDHVYPIKDADGNVISVVRICRNITERKRAEDALREQRDKAQKYLEVAGVMFVVIDVDHKVSLINRKGCEILGYREDEIIGKDWFSNFIPERIRENTKEVFDLLLAGESNVAEYCENPVITVTGEERLVAWHNTVLRDDEGRIIAALSSGEDITERKRAERELRESKELFEKVFVGQRDAIFVLDANRSPTILDCNHAATKIFGYSRQEMLGRTTSFLHVDGESLRDFRKHLYPSITDHGYLYLSEFRMKRKDGTVFPTEHSVVPLEDERGERIGWVSVVHDITKRKQAEEALRESERRFRQIAENACEWIWEVDAHGKYTYASPVVEEILGYTAGEMLDKHFYDLFHPDDREELNKTAFEVFARKQPFHEFINRNLHKNGKEVWLSTSGVPILDREGTLLGYRGADTDITERKKAEEALHRSLDDAAHDRRLLRALSQAAQAVQLARTPDEVYQTVLDEIRNLGYRAIIFTLAEDRNSLILAHLTFDRDLVGIAEEMTNLSAERYQIQLTPGRHYHQIITGGEAVFCADVVDIMAETLPENLRPLAGQLVDLFELGHAIFAPLTVGGTTHGLLGVYNVELTEMDVPAFSAFANQTAIALEKAGLYEVERQRTDELLRSNALIAALSQMATRIKTVPDLDKIMITLGEELQGFGTTIFVALLDSGTKDFVIHYSSVDLGHLSQAEDLVGMRMKGFRVSRDTWPLYRQVVELQRGVFTPEPRELVAAMSPGYSEAIVDRASVLVNMGPHSKAIHLPLVFEGRVQGILALWGEDIREGDIPAFSIFASQVAIALENARLLDTLTKHEKDLQRLSTQLIDAQEAERRRISRELHDEMGQALTAIRFDLAEIEHELHLDISTETRERLAEATSLAEQILEKTRELALDLRPSMLDDLGLLPTLRWYVNRYIKRLNIDIEFEAIDYDERPTAEMETVLYRVVQEALTNVARHAQATRVRIHLRRTESKVIVTIEDNGRGFEVQKVTSRETQEHGAGLLGIKERVASLGGSFDIQSDPGKGTRLSVEIPWGDG
jgi:PAS domain S-box-containing protein